MTNLKLSMDIFIGSIYGDSNYSRNEELNSGEVINKADLDLLTLPRKEKVL